MGSVTADSVDGHEDAQDDPEGAEDEKSDGKADLLVGRAVVNGVGIVHHDILIGYGEGVLYVHCYTRVCWWNWISGDEIWGFGEIPELPKKKKKGERSKVKKIKQLFILKRSSLTMYRGLLAFYAHYITS
ncbi:hypothetical protein GQ457_12G025220 [Hibiscus cannabinus]